MRLLLTFPGASVEFYTHANRPGMFAVGDEADLAGNEGQLEALSHHEVGVAVPRQHLK